MSHNQVDFWSLDCIPKMESGETLFSWCSLYHRVSGASFAITTSKRLFNSVAGGFVRDFPGRIDTFVRVTDGLIGDADHIIKLHTLFRLYAKFRSVETSAKIHTLMRGNSVERLKFILGLPSSRASTCHPLKFCKKCMDEEVASIGFARWWVNLQWPTVWVCEKHNQLLDWVIDGVSGSKSAWFFPSDLKAYEISSMDSRTVTDTKNISDIALLTIQIADFDGGPYLPEILKLVFLHKFKEFGWVTRFGTIQYPEIRDAFLKQFDELSALPGMEFIQSLHNDDFGFLATIIRGPNRYLHPSKYILMIKFLFDGFQSFQSAYQEYAGTVDIEKMKIQILNPDRELREQMLYQLIAVEGRSLNQVSQTMNISIVSVIAWARKNGIEYKRRPRIETPELLSKIQELINRGAGREEIVTELGVRRRWLISFFERHQKLREKWQQQNLIVKTQQRRTAFLKLIEDHQGVPLKELILIPANGYKWLLNHDRQWLQENLKFMSV